MSVEGRRISNKEVALRIAGVIGTATTGAGAIALADSLLQEALHRTPIVSSAPLEVPNCNVEVRRTVNEYEERGGDPTRFDRGTDIEDGVIQGTNVQYYLEGDPQKKVVGSGTTDKNGRLVTPVRSVECNADNGTAVKLHLVLRTSDGRIVDEPMESILNGNWREFVAHVRRGAIPSTPVPGTTPSIITRTITNTVTIPHDEPFFPPDSKEDWYLALLFGALGAVVLGVPAWLAMRGIREERDTANAALATANTNLVTRTNERNAARADAAGFAQGMEQAEDERNQAEDERDQARLDLAATNTALVTRTGELNAMTVDRNNVQAELVTRTDERNDARTELVDTVLETNELLSGCEQQVDHLEDDLNDTQADLAAITTRFRNTVTNLTTELAKGAAARLARIRAIVGGIGPI